MCSATVSAEGRSVLNEGGRPSYRSHREAWIRRRGSSWRAAWSTARSTSRADPARHGADPARTVPGNPGVRQTSPAAVIPSASWPSSASTQARAPPPMANAAVA